MGFGFSGRYGTGLVISRLADNTWSAPSAITISGVGWGLQIGGELTDVMLVLSTDSAVEAFKSRGQVSLGAELGLSAGPYGRSLESDITAGNKGAAHAFSYAHSQGLFMGASLEACVIGQRKDVNKAFYGEARSASALLAGDTPRPRGAEPLYKALDSIIFEGHVPFDVTEKRVQEYAAIESSLSPGIEAGADAGADVGDEIGRHVTGGSALAAAAEQDAYCCTAEGHPASVGGRGSSSSSSSSNLYLGQGGDDFDDIVGTEDSPLTAAAALGGAGPFNRVGGPDETGAVV